MKSKENVSNPEQDSYRVYEKSENLSKRLDLNDLLRRAKEEKKKDKKYNFLVLSGVFTALLFLVAIISF